VDPPDLGCSITIVPLRPVRAKKGTDMPLAEVFERVVGADANVEFRAYDGSVAGTSGSDVRITVRSPLAVRYLAQAPGALGLARAYVSGHLDVDGDMIAALSRMTKAQEHNVSVGEGLRLLQQLGGVKLLYPRLAPPPQEVVPSRRRLTVGRMHSKNRDAESISHHYDVSNRFYEWVLGPSMAYTCACYPTADATLEEAQWYKHDLVARKLDLKPGMRLLDVGCGWGGMVRHAAREYGVKAIGVTLSEQQALWAQQAIKKEGLEDLAEVRFQDYRDVPETGFDAISSIGITEHIGMKNVPGYFSFLNSKLKVGGRMLNHCITRPDNLGPSIFKEGFINRYVFPDGELEGPGWLNATMNDNGFEIRHQENLREHYSKTLIAWCANLDAHWDEAVKEVGQGTARVWRLYMAGCVLGFDTNVVQLHQILGVKLHADGTSGMPLRPDWEPSVARAAAKG
jgi:cyclopropane-fatty-acyl-phospholipid synthase